MQFDEVLRTWKEFFEREGLRYALIGGLAMRAWGSSRTTEDVHFVADLSARDQVVAFAESEGFETLHASDSYSNHVRGAERVDFMYVEEATADRSSGLLMNAGSLATSRSMSHGRNIWQQ